MRKSTRALMGVLFGYYLLLLTWVILYKMCFSLAELDRIRLVNWTLFAQSSYPDGRVNVTEIVSNILVFVPFGIFLSMLRPQWPLWKRIVTLAMSSLALETLQYMLAVGVSDITDLVGNTLGGVLGIALYAGVWRLLKSREKANRLFSVIMLCGGVCGTGLLLLLLLAN